MMVLLGIQACFEQHLPQPMHNICFRNMRLFDLKVILLLAVLVSLGSACGPKSSEGQPGPEKTQVKKQGEEKKVLVELASIQKGLIEEILERSAPLEAEAQVMVLARTQNPAIELLVEEGDLVEEGQVMLKLEDDQQRTAYNQAKIQYENNRIEFERQKKLHAQQLISDADYQTSEFNYEQAKYQLENAQRQLEFTEVLAPISGTVTQRMVKVGDQVTTGTPIFEIIDLQSTVAIIHVPEQYLPKLEPNMPARMVSSTFGDQLFGGFVKRIAPIVEARAGTVKVVVGVQDLGPLRPGVWVDVELVLDSIDDALLIPKRAIVYDNDETFVWKIQQDEKGIPRATRVTVVPRNTDKQNIEPVSGFAIGDQIVVAGQAGLKEGTAIRVLVEPEVTATQKPSGKNPSEDKQS